MAAFSGDSSPIIQHLSLGSRLQPAAVPRCSDVLRLARLAAAQDGTLAAVERPAAIVIEPDGSAGPPSSFGAYGEDPKALYLTKPYSLSTGFSVSKTATYGVWVGGSFKAGIKIFVDGRRIGSARDQLNWPDTFTGLGTVRLVPGRHTLLFRYSGPDLRPGSGGVPPFGVGPIALSAATDDTPVTYSGPRMPDRSAGRASIGSRRCAAEPRLYWQRANAWTDIVFPPVIVVMTTPTAVHTVAELG